LAAGTTSKRKVAILRSMQSCWKRRAWLGRRACQRRWLQGGLLQRRDPARRKRLTAGGLPGLTH
jgi:hypothetical protein